MKHKQWSYVYEDLNPRIFICTRFFQQFTWTVESVPILLYNTNKFISSIILHQDCIVPGLVATQLSELPIKTNLRTNGNGGWIWHVTTVCGWQEACLILLWDARAEHIAGGSLIYHSMPCILLFPQRQKECLSWNVTTVVTKSLESQTKPIRPKYN